MGYLKIHLPVSIIVTLTFAHPVATKAAVKLLACRRVAGEYFLDADFNIRCDSDEYMVWATTVAIPLLILFTFGMPLAYAAAMYRHVKNGTLMLERQVYGFFFSGFRAEIWWFELWNTLRKSLFTISAVLFAPLGVMMQTWAALSLLLTFLVVFSVSQPYEQSYLNNLERSALSISVITLLSGLGLFTNDQSGGSKSEDFAIFLTFIIVFFNILFGLNILVTFSKHTTYCKICKICQKEEVAPIQTSASKIAALRMKIAIQEALRIKAIKKATNIAIQEALRIKAIKKATEITPIKKKQNRMFSSVRLKKVLAHSNATKVIKEATLSLKKHKEKVEIKHNAASIRLQRRLSRRTSIRKPSDNGGSSEGGDLSSSILVTKEKVDRLIQSNTLNEDCMNNLKKVDKQCAEENIKEIVKVGVKVSEPPTTVPATTSVAAAAAATPKIIPNQPETQEQPSDWSEMFDQTSGYPYWYNNKTGISSWDKPVVGKNISTIEKVKKIIKRYN